MERAFCTCDWGSLAVVALQPCSRAVRRAPAPLAAVFGIVGPACLGPTHAACCYRMQGCADAEHHPAAGPCYGRVWQHLGGKQGRKLAGQVASLQMCLHTCCRQQGWRDVESHCWPTLTSTAAACRAGLERQRQSYAADQRCCQPQRLPFVQRRQFLCISLQPERWDAGRHKRAAMDRCVGLLAPPIKQTVYWARAVGCSGLPQTELV